MTMLVDMAIMNHEQTMKDLTTEVRELKEHLEVTAKQIEEIHRFLMEFAHQMENMGNNPMVKGLMGTFLPKMGKRNNGNSQ